MSLRGKEKWMWDRHAPLWVEVFGQREPLPSCLLFLAWKGKIVSGTLIWSFLYTVLLLLKTSGIEMLGKMPFKPFFVCVRTMPAESLTNTPAGAHASLPSLLLSSGVKGLPCEEARASWVLLASLLLFDSSPPSEPAGLVLHWYLAWLSVYFNPVCSKSAVRGRSWFTAWDSTWYGWELLMSWNTSALLNWLWSTDSNWFMVSQLITTDVTPREANSVWSTLVTVFRRK